MSFINFIKFHKVRLKDEWDEVLFKMFPLTIIGSFVLYFGESSVIHHKLLLSLLFALIPIFVGVVGTLIWWLEKKEMEKYED